MRNDCGFLRLFGWTEAEPSRLTGQLTSSGGKRPAKSLPCNRLILLEFVSLWQRLTAKPALAKAKPSGRAGPCDITKARLIAENAKEVSQPDN